jgi:hypothetical protein
MTGSLSACSVYIHPANVKADEAPVSLLADDVTHAKNVPRAIVSRAVHRLCTAHAVDALVEENRMVQSPWFLRLRKSAQGFSFS